jgi:hypothetical protein
MRGSAPCGEPYLRKSAFFRGPGTTARHVLRPSAVNVFSRLFVVPIRGAFGVDDGAAHVAGFDGVVHEVVEIGGVFPGLNAAFFDQFRTQFADAIGERFVPTDIIGGYILDGVELPAGFIEQRADTGKD